MGNYISIKDKKKSKSKPKAEFDLEFYKSLHKHDKFYSDVKFYKNPIDWNKL